IPPANVVTNGKNSISVRIDSDGSYSDITANTSNSLVSGPLQVTLSAIPSLNNVNNNTDAAEYNKEPNNLNNNILTDDRNIYIWNTGYLLDSRTAQYPIMRMKDNSARYLIYASPNGSAQAFYVAANNTAVTVESSYNRYINTGFAIDEFGSWYAGVSNITAASIGVNYFTFHARSASGAGGTTTAFALSGANKRRLVSLANNDSGAAIIDENRVRFPRLSARNTAADPGAAAGSNAFATRVFLSYYDGNSADNPVMFHYGAVGASVGATDSSVGGNFADNGGSSATAFGTNSRTPQGQIVASNSTTPHKSGLYTIAGVFSNGLPVIAWYDRINQNLVFSHGGNTPTTTTNANTSTVTASTATWQANAVIVHSGAGTHVDMAVDHGNNVHLAYYDVMNGGLYYAYIPSTNGRAADSRPDYSQIETVKVDTYLSAGTKITLNIREENHGSPSATVQRYVPYITYFHASFAETVNSIRVAWRKDFSPPAGIDIGSGRAQTIRPGTDAADRFTGAWEVMTVPAQTVPLSDEFISSGVPVSSSIWSVAANRPSGSSLNYTAIDRSIMVAYRTTDWYEGAILKYDIIESQGQMKN
ncbi:MAG: hypothetical protein FWF29_09525, partial [Treponema sp.]|nr:hypothetical protein [Treponema sp.]